MAPDSGAAPLASAASTGGGAPGSAVAAAAGCVEGPAATSTPVVSCSTLRVVDGSAGGGGFTLRVGRGLLGLALPPASGATFATGATMGSRVGKVGGS